MRQRDLTLAVMAVLYVGAWGWSVAAYGQEAGDADTSLIDDVINELAAFVGIVVAGALAAGATYLVKLVRDKLGDAAADRLKAALDRAVVVGGAAAEDSVRAGAAYLKHQLPDSIRRLKMTDEQLRELVAAEMVRRHGSPQAAGSRVSPTAAAGALGGSILGG